MYRASTMQRLTIVGGIVLAASLAGFASDVAAASAVRSFLTGGNARSKQPGEKVVEGTIAWTNRDGTDVMLENGTELVVPPSVDVLPTKLLPRRPVKAYYVKEGDRNVVTAIELRGVHPGEVG